MKLNYIAFISFLTILIILSYQMSINANNLSLIPLWFGTFAALLISFNPVFDHIVKKLISK